MCQTFHLAAFLKLPLPLMLYRIVCGFREIVSSLVLPHHQSRSLPLEADLLLSKLFVKITPKFFESLERKERGNKKVDLWI